MSYRDIPNWPPHWRPRGGAVEQIDGELGVLTQVVVAGEIPNEQPAQIYLFMQCDGRSYVSVLLFSDAVFCREVGELMKRYCGRTLEEIGGLDLSRLL
ncbi:MAG TPA: hypothetical protein VGH16_21160 [Candidatus Binatia bacterium]